MVQTRALSLMLAFVVASHAAFAQVVTTPVPNLRECSTIADDKVRLTCFDDLAKSVPELSTPEAKASAPAPIMPSEDGAWEISERKSPVDDSTTIVAVLEPEAGGSNQSLILTLRCIEKRTEMILSHSRMFVADIGRRDVIYRIDKKQAVEGKWSASTNNQAVFAPGPVINLIRQLPNDGKVFFRVTDYRNDDYGGSFIMRGIDRVRTKLATACKWPAEPTRRP